MNRQTMRRPVVSRSCGARLHLGIRQGIWAFALAVLGLPLLGDGESLRGLPCAAIVSQAEDAPRVLPKGAAQGVISSVTTGELDAGVDVIVVDESGKPVADADVRFLVMRKDYEVDSRRTDRNGRCSTGGWNGNRFLAVRARTETAVSQVLDVSTALKGTLRLVVSPARVCTIRGLCLDAAGHAIRQALATIGATWTFASGGVWFKVESCQTDAAGRFNSGVLWPDFYWVSAAASEFDTLDVEPFTAKVPKVYDVGRLTLVSTHESVDGIVSDSAGRPIAGARVFNSGDAPRVLSTETDSAGRFRLVGLRMGNVFVFAEKTGYRFAGVAAQSDSVGVKIRLMRADEPVPPWKPRRPPMSFADQQKRARRLLEKFWATPPHGRESWTIEYMARIDPHQASKWSVELGGRYDSLVRRVMAEWSDITDAGEVVSLLAGEPDRDAYRIFQSLARRRARSNPQQALRLAEEAIQRARRLDQPDRTGAMAEAAILVARLGRLEAGRKLAQEAAEMATSLKSDDRQGRHRILAAAAVAPFDLARAMSLVKPLADQRQREWALARIATAISARDLKQALEIVGRLGKGSRLPDMARAQIAYDLATTRPEDSLRLVDGMDSQGAAKSKAEALEWLAEAIGPRDRQLAHRLIDESLDIYWNRAKELQRWSDVGGRSGMAAFLARQALEVGYPDMESLINRVLAMRPAWTSARDRVDGKQASILTAMVLATVDPERARHVLLGGRPLPGLAVDVRNLMDERQDLLPAWALVDLDHTVTLIESHLEVARQKGLWTSTMIDTFDLLTSSPERRTQVMLRQLGRWYPGPEL